jgi:DNA polymerase-3 subunit alpha
MKGIDDQNYVKLDILGLDNIELINQTCVAAGIPWVSPDNVDHSDTKVWDSIRDNPCMVFQMESGLARDIYRKMFSKENLTKIKGYSPNITPIDILSIICAAIRPAGESFRDRMAAGQLNDNGHPALNEFLSDTLGYLTYQEQIIDFLYIFCGFTKSKADIVRRGFAKKTGTEQFLPEIKSGFIKTMNENYGEDTAKYEHLIEAFLKIIEDASF